MEPKKLLLIINPKSGVNSKEGMAGSVSSRLSDFGYSVDTQYTKAPGHATALASEAVERRYDAVVVCGGDGTVNETARSLCGTDVALGIIPSGSGNGLARHLGIPVEEMLSLDVIGKGHLLRCDSGLANGRHFFCTFGLGFDAYVSKLFAGEKRRGRMTYMKLVMSEFSKYKSQRYTIEANGETLEREAFVVAVCNASQYGNNTFIAPGASVCDGMLDIVVVERGNQLSLVQTGLDLVTGMTPYNHHVETLRVNEATIGLPEGAYAHIDGEPLDIEGPLHIKCLPNSLKVFANDNIERFTPFITPIDMTLRDWGIAISKLFK